MVMRGSAGLEDSWEHWIEAETYKSPKVGMKFTRNVKFTAFWNVAFSNDNGLLGRGPKGLTKRREVNQMFVTFPCRG